MSHSQNRQSRRALLRAGGALAAGAVAAPSILRRAYAQSTEGQVVFACDGGSTQSIFEKKIIPPFTRQTGIKVQYVPGQPADIVAKLRAQKGNAGIDAAWLAGAVTYVAIDQGLLQKVDESLVPNARNLDPKVTREPQILPIAVSGNCLIYEKPVYRKNGWKTPSSWFDLWDTKLAKHTGMYSMNSTGGVEMLLQVAKELTGDYTNLDPAFAKFHDLRSNIYQFFATAGAWETALQQGELWLGVNSYTRAIQLTQAGQPIGVVLPATGMAGHQLHLGIPSGAAHPKAAHAWANYLLDGTTQQLIVENIGYSPSTLGTKIPDDIAMFFPKPGQMWFPDWRKIGGEFDKIVDRWQREVEG